jgi:hypothetical protein
MGKLEKVSRSRRSLALVLLVSLVGLLPVAPAYAGHGTCNLELTPSTSSGTLGTAHTITATLVDGADPNQDCDVNSGAVDIYFEVVSGDTSATYAGNVDRQDTPGEPDMVCTVPGGADDDCTVTYTRTGGTGTDTIRGWVAHEPSDQDTATRTWTAAPGALLNVEPESDTNPPQTAHTLTATARSSGGALASGVNVDFEIISGPNDALNNARADLECTTGANGTCSVTYTDASNNPAPPNNVDTICAWLDPEDDDVFAAAGTDPADGGDCDQETVNETENSAVAGNDTFGNDSTDNVTKSWVAPPTLTITPASDSAPVGTCNPFTITLQQGGAGVADVFIDVEQVHSAANNNTANDEPTVSFCTPTSGPNPSAVNVAAGDRVETPDNPGTAGGETALDTNANGQVTIGITVARRGTSNGSGNVTITAWDENDTDNDDPDAGEPQATATKTWTAPSLTISPSADTASVGTCNPFTVTLRDGSNQPVGGVELDVEQVHSLATNGTSGDEPTVSFCTPSTADGPNPSAVEVGRGDLTETPDNLGTSGGVIGNETNSSGQVTFGVRVAPSGSSDGTGTVAITVFHDDVDNNDDPDGAETRAAATKTWVAAEARTIDCDPETASVQLGTTATVSCLVEDRFGDPLAGQAVVFTSTGPGRLSSATRALTDATGRVTVSASSFQAGTQQILSTLESDLLGLEPAEVDQCDRLAGDPSGAPEGDCSDTVTVSWTLPTSGTPVPAVCRTTPGAFIGTDGNDLIVGTSGNDVICGRGGNDRLVGRDGSDRLLGGAGGDTLLGGEGSDRLAGGADPDTLSGGDGADLLSGGGGGDFLKGKDGPDTMRGNAGGDLLRGGRGNDRMNGGAGDDHCAGGPGRNRQRSC